MADNDNGNHTLYVSKNVMVFICIATQCFLGLMGAAVGKYIESPWLSWCGWGIGSISLIGTFFNSLSDNDKLVLLASWN